MLLLQLIYRQLLAFNKSFEGDKRLNSYPLIGKPWPVIAILFLYGLTSLKWGPKFMAKRKPFKVDGVMQVYNAMQILLNGYMVVLSLRNILARDDFKLICQEYDPTDTSPATMDLLVPALIYYYLKYFDLLDTVFFLARKKFNQITFLHVYHHSIIIVGGYAYTLLMFGTHFTFIGIINGFIHMIMYVYYLLAAAKLNINLERFKRVLTLMQLLQFVLVAIHMAIPLFINECSLPKTLLILTLVQSLFMIALFGHFYYKAYILKDRERQTTKDKRLNSYPLIGKPWPIIAILILYRFTALKWGPKFMAKRKPFKVDGVMQVYNAMQILLNGYGLLVGLRNILARDDFKLICQEYDPTDTSPATMELLVPTLIYYYLKYFDLLDTIFFLARKKFNQITFLHVYHHVLMVLSVYIYVSSFYATHFISIGIINGFIHMIMYAYYLLAALKLNINLERFKRVLTQMQLLQFVLVAIHMAIPLFINECNLPKALLVLTLVQSLFMIALFGHFYYKAYILKDRERQKSK